MHSLGTDLLLAVLSFLPAHDMVACAGISRRFRELFVGADGVSSASATLYRRLCQLTLPGWQPRTGDTGSSSISGGETWRDVFVRALHEIGDRDFHRYAPVARAWQRITAWLRMNAPHILPTLLPGLSAADAHRAAEQMPASFRVLPTDLILSSMIYEGCG